MPGKLELSFNSTRISDFPLDQEVITIGRKSDNDICIENLSVSGHHAKLLTIFHDSFLEDLGSTNGTYVNGQPIEKHALKNGDIIVIGKHELKYVSDNLAVTNDYDKTVFIRPNIARMPTPSARQTSFVQDRKPISPANLSNAKLHVLTGKNAGKKIPLHKESTKIGKPGVLVIAINKRPDGHFIVCIEQGKNNAVLCINGDEVGSRSVKLHNHDVIEFSRMKIEYCLAL